jgi:hypothetical protein
VVGVLLRGLRGAVSASSFGELRANKQTEF